MADRLTRSETDRKIAGVCGGLAAYFGIDPTLVRVAAVVAAFMGWGVLAYIIMWIVVPSGPTPPHSSSSAIHIAEDRYARGEISAEDLARIRADLGGHA